jgi:hypothetical protein
MVVRRRGATKSKQFAEARSSGLYLLDHLRVERGGRLVEEHDLRRHAHGARSQPAADPAAADNIAKAAAAAMEYVESAPPARGYVPGMLSAAS